MDQTYQVMQKKSKLKERIIKELIEGENNERNQKFYTGRANSGTYYSLIIGKSRKHNANIFNRDDEVEWSGSGNEYDE